MQLIFYTSNFLYYRKLMKMFVLDYVPILINIIIELL